MQLPFVSRKEHEQEIEKLQKEVERWKRQLERCNTENEALNNKFDEVLPKLARPYIVRPGERNPNFRLVVEFSPMWVQECFYHGNDQMMIRYTSERLAYQIESELMKMNFVRLEDVERMKPQW